VAGVDREEDEGEEAEEGPLDLRPSTARALWVVLALVGWTVGKNLLKARVKHDGDPEWVAAAIGVPLLFLAGAWLWARWTLPRRILAGAEGLEIHGWNSRDRLTWAAVKEARHVDRLWSPTRWILEDRAGRTRTLYRLGLGEEDWEALGKLLRTMPARHR
jgi:hypothetical protein